MGRGRTRQSDVPAWLIELLSPLALFVVPFLWLYYHIPAVVVFWAILMSWLYYLFAAPTTCGAVKSDGRSTCKNNAYGVLRACKQVRAHQHEKNRRLLRQLRRPLTRFPPVTRATVPRPRKAGPTPVYSYAPPVQPSRTKLETIVSVASVAGVAISAFSFILSIVVWRFPVK